MTPGGKPSFTNPIESFYSTAYVGIPTYQSPPLLTASRHRIRLKIALQDYERKGATQVSKNQYNAPAMEVVQFGKEDIVCTVSGWTPDGTKPGFGITGEDKDHPFTDGDF